MRTHRTNRKTCRDKAARSANQSEQFVVSALLVLAAFVRASRTSRTREPVLARASLLRFTLAPDVTYSHPLATKLRRLDEPPSHRQEPLFMTLLSMNEITTFRWSLEQDVENYQQAGYRSIGVWRQKLADYDRNARSIYWPTADSRFPICCGPAGSPAATAARSKRASTTRRMRCDWRPACRPAAW